MAQRTELTRCETFCTSCAQSFLSFDQAIPRRQSAEWVFRSRVPPPPPLPAWTESTTLLVPVIGYGGRIAIDFLVVEKLRYVRVVFTLRRQFLARCGGVVESAAGDALTPARDDGMVSRADALHANADFMPKRRRSMRDRGVHSGGNVLRIDQDVARGQPELRQASGFFFLQELTASGFIRASDG